MKDAERKSWTKTELDRLRPSKRRRSNRPSGHATDHASHTADSTIGDDAASASVS
ncbi:hypothetical protein LVY72_04190 [Arthrobacter sp. I2-34]|uniref:Uncharacterized protein n=1 Tax=Arthrobacter hankyongi TaxID=2904801 RepID=A0ABS9L381_9MICC|nr:hypothetical protein [Arthrobacter hankyongi]MCG2621113.1 hypothetical protein [Arthrobacter hankyongi]